MRVMIYENQIIIEYLNYQDLYAKRLMSYAEETVQLNLVN